MSGFYDYPMPKSFADYRPASRSSNTRSPSPTISGLSTGSSSTTVSRVEEDGDGWLVTTDDGTTCR